MASSKYDPQVSAELGSLRRKAEERISEWDLEFSAPSEKTNVIHELQVHQVELMMQNDELQRTHQQLTLSRNYYQQLFNHSPAGYALLNERGEILEQNETLFKLLAFSEQQLRATQFFVDMVHPDDRANYRARFRAFYNQPEGKTLELNLADGNGNPIPVRIDACRFRRSERSDVLPGVTDLLLSITDLRQQRLLEAEIERQMDETLFKSKKMATVGQLVDSFTHDLCSVIGGGMLSLTTLQDELQKLQQLLSAEAIDRQRVLEAINLAVEDTQAALRAQRKTTDMAYSFKRTSIDQTNERPRLFKLSQLVDDIATSLRTQLKQQNIQLVTDCDPDLQVRGIPGTIDQLLLNLISNSRVHGFDENGGTIRIQADCDGQQLQLRYSDDGCGIHPDMQDKVFERFYTSNASSGSTGLGLYIVRSLVEKQLQGELRMDSTPGQGVRFIFRIPLKRINDQLTLVVLSNPDA